MKYTFNAARFGLRGWEGQGGVLYDEADSTLYEVSESAFLLLNSLWLQADPQSAMELARNLLGEPPERVDVELVEAVLNDFRKMGAVTCLSA